MVHSDAGVNGSKGEETDVNGPNTGGKVGEFVLLDSSGLVPQTRKLTHLPTCQPPPETRNPEPLHP